jgi:hypothetical protein
MGAPAFGHLQSIIRRGAQPGLDGQISKTCPAPFAKIF